MSRGEFSNSYLYADDVLLFCKATERNVVAIMDIFSKYATVSSQFFNPAKSRVYFGPGVTPHVTALIQRQLGFITVNFPLSYLRVPFFKGMPRRVFLTPIADRIITKFDRWLGRTLVMVGGICLVKSVIAGSTIHSMIVYKWPISLLKRLDGACWSFIWSMIMLRLVGV